MLAQSEEPSAVLCAGFQVPGSDFPLREKKLRSIHWIRLKITEKLDDSDNANFADPEFQDDSDTSDFPYFWMIRIGTYANDSFGSNVHYPPPRGG